MRTICAILCTFWLGCSASSTRPLVDPPASPYEPREVIDDSALELFRQNAVDGAFVVLDARRSITTVVNPALASRGFLPASTFKIPNTLIGLETGVIPDERFSQRWDGVDRGRAEWNRDQDLASAMKYSVVWFYQEVARRIAQPRMQKWVDALDYGNHDTSGRIEAFWLEGGSLRITPRQQVDFMRRLHTGKLPVSREHVALLERIITLDTRHGVVLRGKTGGAVPDNTTVGWLVGMVERGPDDFFYATILTAPGNQFERIAPLRQAIARKLLVRTGALPVEMETE